MEQAIILQHTTTGFRSLYVRMVERMNTTPEHGLEHCVIRNLAMEETKGRWRIYEMKSSTDTIQEEP